MRNLQIVLSFSFTNKQFIMRNLLSLLVIMLSGIFISCGGGGGMSAKAKKNMETNTAIMKAYEAGDFSKMNEYMAADAVDHGGENGTPRRHRDER